MLFLIINELIKFIKLTVVRVRQQLRRPWAEQSSWKSARGACKVSRFRDCSRAYLHAQPIFIKRLHIGLE